MSKSSTGFPVLAASAIIEIAHRGTSAHRQIEVFEQSKEDFRAVVDWLIAETITAALHHGRELWYGNERNIGIRTREIADDLGITIHVSA